MGSKVGHGIGGHGAMVTPLNLLEYEAAARDVLPAMVYDFIAGGAWDEGTLRRNRAAFADIALRPRVLVDVSQRDLSTQVLGQRVAFPALVAPMSFHRLTHPEGELATARAAGAAGTILALSTAASCTLEEVAAAASGPLWFQLYVYRDRGVTEGLVRRAEKAGYRALCLTVDLQVLGLRERDIRNRFTLPEGVVHANLLEAGLQHLPKGVSGSALSTYVRSLYDPSLTWKDVGWLRSITSLPIVVKGILTPEDARLAVEHGAKGIVVSNHGGRQLDGAPASMEVLPEIVDAVGGSVDVLVDGGVRRGTDVLKALALGARAVLVGRPVLWGLAVAGEAGARRVLQLLRDELEAAMALAGCPTIGSIKRDLVRWQRNTLAP